MVYSFYAPDVGMFLELFHLISKKPYSKIVSVFQFKTRNLWRRICRGLEKDGLQAVLSVER